MQFGNDMMKSCYYSTGQQFNLIVQSIITFLPTFEFVAGRAIYEHVVLASVVFSHLKIVLIEFFLKWDKQIY
jgi:hypothetical protein